MLCNHDHVYQGKPILRVVQPTRSVACTGLHGYALSLFRTSSIPSMGNVIYNLINF
jgi:hypothetical protein